MPWQQRSRPSGRGGGGGRGGEGVTPHTKLLHTRGLLTLCMLIELPFMLLHYAGNRRCRGEGGGWGTAIHGAMQGVTAIMQGGAHMHFPIEGIHQTVQVYTGLTMATVHHSQSGPFGCTTCTSA